MHADAIRRAAAKVRETGVLRDHLLHPDESAMAFALIRKAQLELLMRHAEREDRRDGEPRGCDGALVLGAWLYAQGWEAECDSPEETRFGYGARRTGGTSRASRRRW